MIFFEKFEKRTSFWRNFRDELETIENPLDRTIRFWNQAPINARTCDPYDRTTWPEAWQLLDENKYCEFGKILAMYYTISLTDRFANSEFKICIAQDRVAQKIYYLLIIDENIIGFEYNNSIHVSQLPDTLEMQSVYLMDNDKDN
jgi:hypothetical protein